MLTVEELQSFTAEIAAAFDAGLIRHPVHLSDGNEAALIECFREIDPEDWCLGGWRFHYQCLLHGVAREALRSAIFRGDSIALCFPARRILCSALVGGIFPIAVGIASALQRSGAARRVHCWAGERSAEGGQFHECAKYAWNHALPVRWIVEDNGKSVLTDTRAAWGSVTLECDSPRYPTIVSYRYQSRYPHAGSGARVEF